MADVMPPAETDISEELVVALLREQHPELVELGVRFENNGWDNAVYRVGDTLAARLPRRAICAALLPDELKWLPMLAPALPLPITAAVRVGAPGCGYPWPWSITPWFDGASWADTDVRDHVEAATSLGAFLRALQSEIAPPDAPTNPYRGTPLVDRDPAFRDRITQLGASVSDAVVDVWDAALAARPSSEHRWVHGDLHPANIVVNEGRLSAVIDWVDLSGGDIAYDLAAAWLCFDEPVARDAFMTSTGVDDEPTWVRARGCALSHGIACLASSADNPRMHAVGEKTVASVLAG